MSDTLQEQEDRMTNQTTNYNCCKGGDHHMPWCFEAVRVPALGGQNFAQPPTHVEGVRLTRSQIGWQSEKLPIHGCRVVDNTGRLIASDVYDEEIADQIVTEHNQHQALVAERERLRAALLNAKRCLERPDRSDLSVRKAIEKADSALCNNE